MATYVICPRCQGELPPDAPEGLCPECLLRQALEAPGMDSVPPVETGPYRRHFVPPAPEDLARHFPQLEILEFVGQGGMGAVYKARQPALDRLVAVKVLSPEAAGDPAFAERFTREARSLARFNHPNIVSIYDFGEAGGFYTITMEFVAGQNLRQLMQTGGLTEVRVLRIVTQVCDALQYAHDGGVVHRDIKPENILLDARGQVKIADFGLAKLMGREPACLSLTGSHDVMGTLYYMAPEQLLRAHEVDHRADLYSLGVVFYEMLTGGLPVGRFAPPSHGAGVDARLDAIVLRALESKPEHRYQDAAEIKLHVEGILSGPLVPAAARADWPCVRFTIPNVSWTCARVEGEMYRDETTLILDFCVVGHTRSSAQKEVRIPFSEIRRISCHVPRWPGLPGWMAAWRKAEIFVRVFDPANFADLPVGRYGYVWGQLQVDWGDREAAEELVESIVRSPLLGLGAAGPTGQLAALDCARRPADQLAALDRARRQLLPVALTLLLTAAAGLVSTLALVLVLTRDSDQERHTGSKRLLVAAAALLVAPCVGLILTGAVQMMRLRSYRRCLAAALVAVLPWSPSWLLGLTVGIWAVVVLGRREVMLAFLREGKGAAPHPGGDPEPPGPVAGKLRSWWRSFAGYFLTLPGTRPEGTDQPVQHRFPGEGA
jgi:serine/threonine protein kinase